MLLSSAFFVSETVSVAGAFTLLSCSTTFTSAITLSPDTTSTFFVRGPDLPAASSSNCFFAASTWLGSKKTCSWGITGPGSSAYNRPGSIKKVLTAKRIPVRPFSNLGTILSFVFFFILYSSDSGIILSQNYNKRKPTAGYRFALPYIAEGINFHYYFLFFFLRMLVVLSRSTGILYHQAPAAIQSIVATSTRP